MKSSQTASASEKKENTPASSKLINSVPIGRELSDVYLRHPMDDSSTDSEGEEMDPKGDFVANCYR